LNLLQRQNSDISVENRGGNVVVLDPALRGRPRPSIAHGAQPQARSEGFAKASAFQCFFRTSDGRDAGIDIELYGHINGALDDKIA